MSMSVAEKSAARRAKILARGKDRLATVTGGMATADLPQPSPETTSGEPFSAAKAEAELEKAFAEMENTATTTTTSATATSPITSSSTPTAATTSTPTVTVADPHEFLTAADAASFTPPPSPPSSSQDSQLAFSSFSNASSASSAIAAAARRRALKEQASMNEIDMTLPPPLSPITLWQRRVQAQIKELKPVRAVTVSIVVVLAILVGLGLIESGLSWLILVEILSNSLVYIMEATTSKKVTTGTAASRPASSTIKTRAPPPAPSDDPDVIDIDTDDYRATAQSSQSMNPFASLGLGGVGGGSGAGGMNLSGLGLPEGTDTILQALQLLMKYAAAMKQLMHDGMIFIFLTVVVNAITQLIQDERIIYV